MNTEQTRPRSLREIELEVMAEGREWTRQRLQQRLQEEADRHGGVFPLSGRRLVHRRSRPMQMRTGAGVVKLEVLYGQDATDQHWGCPIREHWGLTQHQQLSLALEDKLAFTITATASYEEAAALGAEVGSSGHRLLTAFPDAALGFPRRGPKAGATQNPAGGDRTPASARQTGRAHARWLAGAPARAGLGEKENQENRVEWHEWKTGVYYPQEQAARTAGGRGVIAGKLVIGWQGDPVEFGRRLHWEALRGGLGRARAKLVVADGAPWIWNVAQDRWQGATEVLDFYHASEHLWDLGRALNGDDEAATARWAEPLRHQLRHGSEQPVLDGNRRFESSQRRSWQGGGARTELFRLPCRKDELPDHPPARLAHRLRSR